MRSSLALILPMAALAVAQSSSTTSVDPHPATNYLSQTNSNGVVTGQPTPATNVGSAATNVGTPATNVGTPATSVGNPGQAVTSQPAVATIPAGLPSGTNTIYIANSTVLVSVGSSTTVVISTSSSSSSSSVTSGSGSTTAASSAGASGSQQTTTTTSAASTSSTARAGAANAYKVYYASGALVAAGSFFVAFM